MKTTPPTSPELQAVLQNQKAIAAAQASAVQLRGVIMAQQAKAGTLSEQAADLQALETEREDMLADIATGQDRAKELKALDVRLAQQREKLDEQDTQAAVEQTVAGLTRKLERAEADAAALTDVRTALLRQLLAVRSEALGAEYKAKALELKNTFDRLSINCRLLKKFGHRYSDAEIYGALVIPSFPVTSAQVDKSANHPYRIVDTSNDTQAALAPTLASEIAALRELGVEFDG